MELENIDFEGNGSVDNNNGNSNTGNTTVQKTEDVTALDGSKDKVDINDNSTKVDEKPDNVSDSNNNDNKDNNDSSTGELKPGTELEFDGKVYKVDDKGNVVDSDNNIFKNADEVDEWLKELNVTDSDTTLDINNIKEAVGVNITDENGNDIEFTNDVEGIKNYIQSVIDVKSEEIQQAAINKIFTDNPLVKQFIDYCQVNGTYRGFGEIPDRRGIEVDKDNEQQQEYIIRMAAQEFGNASLNDNYIKYLKDTGGLYDEAVNQLKALGAKDEQYKKQIEQQAELSRQQEQAELQEYWKSVSDAIESRTIAGYKIPDSFIKTENGKKVTVTANDFYNYLSKPAAVDERGNTITAYQRDLNNLSDKAALEKDLLEAWLVFTGGSYKDLVDMAIREEKVKRLQLTAKDNRTRKTVKIVKNNDKVDMNDILL